MPRWEKKGGWWESGGRQCFLGGHGGRGRDGGGGGTSLFFFPDGGLSLGGPGRLLTQRLTRGRSNATFGFFGAEQIADGNRSNKTRGGHGGSPSGSQRGTFSWGGPFRWPLLLRPSPPDFIGGGRLAGGKGWGDVISGTKHQALGERKHYQGAGVRSVLPIPPRRSGKMEHK